MSLSQVEIPFAASDGSLLARLWLGDRTGASILVLSDEEASGAQEEKTQLLEGRIYDYELRGAPSGLAIRADEVVQPNLARPHVGRMETGLQTGMLAFALVEGDTIRSTALVEVRTSKIDYRKHYREMLDRIAEVSVALVMNVKGPAAARMTTDPHMDGPTAHQRLAFVRAVLSSAAFEAAVERIIRMPHERPAEETQERDIRRGLRSSASISRQIASASRRVPLPAGH
ncbi:MAG: DUF2357 domain-containing protein, partial [Anaerolineaceae bacterium]